MRVRGFLVVLLFAIIESIYAYTIAYINLAGATKTVSIYYDLPGNPTDYAARKYNISKQAYSDVVGAVIVREDYGGKSRLKLTYSIADGGVLDQDGQVNGVIIDPVGLSTTNLALTGDNIWLYILGITTLLGTGAWFVRKAVGR